MKLEMTNGYNAHRTISPFLELGAYEALWLKDKASFKRMATMFAKSAGSLPSDFIDPETAEHYAHSVWEKFRGSHLMNLGIGYTGRQNIRANFVMPLTQ